MILAGKFICKVSHIQGSGLHIAEMVKGKIYDVYYDDKYTFVEEAKYFIQYKNEPVYFQYYDVVFEEHFCTLSELRLEKIKKLNERSSFFCKNKILC